MTTTHKTRGVIRLHIGHLNLHCKLHYHIATQLKEKGNSTLFQILVEELQDHLSI